MVIIDMQHLYVQGMRGGWVGRQMLLLPTTLASWAHAMHLHVNKCSKQDQLGELVLHHCSLLTQLSGLPTFDWLLGATVTHTQQT